jgi:hypothetical protein
LALVERVEALARQPDRRFFHWEIEFPEVFFGFADLQERHLKHKNDILEGSAGFDAVVGNPPYGGTLDAFTKGALSIHVPLTKSNPDTAIAFMEHGMHLLKRVGWLGVIVPKPLTYSYSWRETRAFLSGSLRQLLDVSRAWHEVLLEQVVIVAEKGKCQESYLRQTMMEGCLSPARVIASAWAQRFDTLPCALTDREQQLLEAARIDRLTVGDICKTFRGLGLQREISNVGQIPIVGGRDLERWRIRSFSGYLAEIGPDQLAKFQRPKLLFQNIIAHVVNPDPHVMLIGSYDTNCTITLDTVNNIIARSPETDLLAVLALLHSQFANWFVFAVIYNKAIRTMHFDQYFLNKLPLPPHFAELQDTLATSARISINAALRAGGVLTQVNEEWRALGVSKLWSEKRATGALVNACSGMDGAHDEIAPPPVRLAWSSFLRRFAPDLRDALREKRMASATIDETILSAYGAEDFREILPRSVNT